jgi:hypothetical protein
VAAVGSTVRLRPFQVSIATVVVHPRHHAWLDEVLASDARESERENAVVTVSEVS